MAGRARKAKYVSISKSLLLTVLTTSTIVTTVLTFVQLTIEYKARTSELEAVIVTMEGSLVPAVAEKLWNIDMDGLKVQMQPVLSSIDASSILVRNDKGEVVYENKIENFTPNHPQKSLLRVRKTQEDGTKIDLGELEVVMYKDKIIADVRNRFIIVLMLNGLKTAIVAAALLFMFHRKIARPLLEISNYFVRNRDLTKLTGEEFKVSQRDNVNDELTLMIEHIGLREKTLAEWAKDQTQKMRRAEQALVDADEVIKQEKMRAEASARLAQLGEMATSIAHEINNPLTIIAGYNHIIRRQASAEVINPDKIIEQTKNTEKTIGRISKIITGLRAYARDGSADPKTWVSMSQIVDDTMAMIEARMRTNAIDVRLVKPADSQWGVQCRSVQIVQVLVAILNNAVDAISGMESRWVEIETKIVNGKFHILLTDSGNGIDPKVEAKIFEPFFTTKTVGHGTGLGLSIAFGIIKDHDGRVYVDRNCKNTRFVIELDAVEAPANAEVQSA